jgi:hypothetical protein
LLWGRLLRARDRARARKGFSVGKYSFDYERLIHSAEQFESSDCCPVQVAAPQAQGAAERPKIADARWRVSAGQPCQKVNLVQTTAAKLRAFGSIDSIESIESIDCISAHAEGFLKAVGRKPSGEGSIVHRTACAVPL